MSKTTLTSPVSIQTSQYRDVKIHKHQQLRSRRNLYLIYPTHPALLIPRYSQKLAVPDRTQTMMASY